MNVIILLVAYILVINFIAFLLMGIDKRRAIKHAFRIPEATLFLFAIMGGSIGSILGMYTFRHKTRHWYFIAINTAALTVQIILLAWLVF